MEYKWLYADLMQDPELEEFLDNTCGKGICVCRREMSSRTVNRYVLNSDTNKCVIHRIDNEVWHEIVSRNTQESWKIHAREYWKDWKLRWT